MKQRIRGLVSLHEIPFLLAPYKRRRAIVCVVQKEEEMKTRGEKKVEVLEDSRSIAKYHGCCFVSAPCDIPFKHFSSSHFLPFFGRKVVERKGG